MASPISRRVITSCWCSCRAADIAARVRKDALPCASPAPPPTARERCLSGERRLIRRWQAHQPSPRLLGVCGVRHGVAPFGRQDRPELPLDEAALFGCAVLTGVGAVVNTAQVRAGASVAVIGLGGVGLASLLGARGGRRAARSSRSTCRTTNSSSAKSAGRDAHASMRATRTAQEQDTRIDSGRRRVSPSRWPARCARWTSPTGSPGAAALRSPPACRRRPRRCRCRRSIWSPRSERSRAATSEPACRRATSRATSTCIAQGRLPVDRADERQARSSRRSTGASTCCTKARRCARSSCFELRLIRRSLMRVTKCHDEQNDKLDGSGGRPVQAVG